MRVNMRALLSIVLASVLVSPLNAFAQAARSASWSRSLKAAVLSWFSYLMMGTYSTRLSVLMGSLFDALKSPCLIARFARVGGKRNRSLLK
jgi:hypothetical protein